MANSAMKALDRLVGDWTIEAQGPALGDTTVTARVSFSWALAGTALVQRGEVDHPQAPATLSVITPRTTPTSSTTSTTAASSGSTG